MLKAISVWTKKCIVHSFMTTVCGPLITQLVNYVGHLNSCFQKRGGGQGSVRKRNHRICLTYVGRSSLCIRELKVFT